MKTIPQRRKIFFSQYKFDEIKWRSREMSQNYEKVQKFEITLLKTQSGSKKIYK